MSTTKKKSAKAKAVGGYDLSHGAFVEDACLHLRHPAFNHELYVGKGVDKAGRREGAKDPKPVRVHLRRIDSQAMVEKKRQLQRAATAQAGGKEIAEEVQNDIDETMLKFSILEFENVYYKGRALDAADEEDKNLFINMQNNYSVQVMIFIAEVENFFDEGCKG